MGISTFGLLTGEHGKDGTNLILGYASKPPDPNGTLASFMDVYSTNMPNMVISCNFKGNLTHPYMKRSVSKSALGIPCYSEIKSAVIVPLLLPIIPV